MSEDEFRQQIQAQAVQQQAMLQAQLGEADARANRENALALKEMNNAE